jgi:hypothetical protein
LCGVAGFVNIHACDTARSVTMVPTDRMSWSWRPALEVGGGTGKDRGGDLVVCGPAVSIRGVLGGGGLAALVDEVEATEVEMTHD